MCVHRAWAYRRAFPLGIVEESLLGQVDLVAPGFPKVSLLLRPADVHRQGATLPQLFVLSRFALPVLFRWGLVSKCFPIPLVLASPLPVTTGLRDEKSKIERGPSLLAAFDLPVEVPGGWTRSES